MKFTDFLNEELTPKQSQSLAKKIEAVASKMRSDTFKKIMRNVPNNAAAVLNNDNGVTFKLDTRYTGWLGGWGNQDKGVSISFKQDVDNAQTRQLIILRRGVVIFGVDDGNDWKYIIQGEDIDAKTIQSDIKNYGKYLKLIGAKDVSGEIISYMSDYVKIKDPKIAIKIKKQSEMKRAKVNKVLDELSDWYYDNKNDIEEHIGGDVRGNQIYTIKSYKKTLNGYNV